MGKKDIFLTVRTFETNRVKDQFTAREILKRIPKKYITKQKDFVSKHKGKVGYTQFKLDKKQSTLMSFRTLI